MYPEAKEAYESQKEEGCKGEIERENTGRRESKIETDRVRVLEPFSTDFTLCCSHKLQTHRSNQNPIRLFAFSNLI